MPTGCTGAGTYVSNCEASSDRRSLLRISLVFCDPEPLQLPRGTDQCDFRIYQDPAADGQTSPAGARRGVLGRRNAGAASKIAAGLQGNAQGNAEANGS